MTDEQNEILEFVETMVARLVHGGYDRMASVLGGVADALHRGETVWAVILGCEAADAGDLGPAFVENMRVAFGVGRVR